MIRPTPPLSVSWDISSDRHPGAFDAYRDSLADLYDVQRAVAPADAPFESRTTVFKFGASVLGRGQSGGQTMVRSAEIIRRSQMDHVSIVVNLADGVVDAGGRDGAVSAGTVQFRDLAKPSVARTGRVDLINLIAPRSSVPGWLLGRRLHGLHLPPESAGGRLVSSHLQTLAAVAPMLSEEEGIASIEAAFLIAERFLGGKTGALSPLQVEAVQRTIRRRAIRVLDVQHATRKPDFADIAQVIGVSRSSLYRAFAAHGGVQTYMTRRHLNRAYAILRARATNTPSVEMVAQQSGFSGTIQFARAFRAQFGIDPSDVRLAMSDADGLPSSADAEGPHRNALHGVILDWLRLSDETP